MANEENLLLKELHRQQGYNAGLANNSSDIFEKSPAYIGGFGEGKQQFSEKITETFKQKVDLYTKQKNIFDL